MYLSVCGCCVVISGVFVVSGGLMRWLVCCDYCSGWLYCPGSLVCLVFDLLWVAGLVFVDVCGFGFGFTCDLC